ncbi:MAG TPA: group II intron maturase-specific domain-containing protein [Planctomycetota bacterium]|nr:group II intron maturase-specific domain-containing protein [Planctomycetota bacterium]
MAVRPNNPDEKVRELQRTLYRCAKRSRTRRFHALYDRICRGDVLREAWRRVRERVHDLTDASRGGAKDVKAVIATLNPVLRGWGNYFKTGNAALKFTQLDEYVRDRLARWMWRRGGQRTSFRFDRWPAARLHALGLHRLRGTVCYPVNATSAKTLGKPCAGNPHARFERGGWNRLLDSRMPRQ